MIRSLPTLLVDAAEKRRFLLFLVAAVLSIPLGFLVVSPPRAEKLIGAWGYYYILGVFALFVVYGVRLAAARRATWLGWLRGPGVPGLMIAAGTAFTIWSDPFTHKVLFDEYVLQGTAFHMHATKEIGTIVRAYDIQGTWLPIDTFLDKRPYFFTFLVSLVHDFTGYRLANIFIVNAVLTPVFLGLVYWLARTIVGRGPALLALALLATMPLLAQQASGAGMELHNLAMLALVMAAAVLYLRRPEPDRLSFLVLGAVLLAQSRYESVIFVVPAAAVIVTGWWRSGRIFIPWPAVVAPLLLVPYAWHNRVLTATPLLWQLNEGQSSRFSVNYLASNLEGAWRFFFNTSPNLANSWYLSGLGLLGVGAVAFIAWRWARTTPRPPLAPGAVILLAFGAGIAGNLAMLMFYYWSRLDDVIASRFALPACFLLALLAAIAVERLASRRWPALQLATLGLAIWALGWGIPASARRSYTTQNLVMQEVDWEHAVLMQRRGPLLYITNKSTIPFVLWRVPTLLQAVGRQRGDQIRYHLQQGTFREVIVAQAIRPTSVRGEMGVDPRDAMPDNYRLETIALRRFGGRWMRLSRIVAIDPPSTANPAAAKPPAE